MMKRDKVVFNFVTSKVADAADFGDASEEAPNTKRGRSQSSIRRLGKPREAYLLTPVTRYPNSSRRHVRPTAAPRELPSHLELPPLLEHPGEEMDMELDMGKGTTWGGAFGMKDGNDEEMFTLTDCSR